MNQWKILTPIFVVALLAFAFWYGGDAPEHRGWTVEQVDIQQENLQTNLQDDYKYNFEENLEYDLEIDAEIPEIEPEIPPETEIEDPQELEIIPETQPEASPEASEQEDSKKQEIEEINLLVTLSVRCDTILDHLDWLTAGKESLVPADGVIFPATEVVFYEGESVFDVLLREMKGAGIHMEYENTPMYNAAYIEGIGNLYEYDCGQLSGWMFRVNGLFSNTSCSQYTLQNGDVVEWVYSCDLGEDVGGGL